MFGVALAVFVGMRILLPGGLRTDHYHATVNELPDFAQRR